MGLTDAIPIRAEVDLGALVRNLQRLQSLAGSAACVGIVKADAYGHGAVPVARALAHAGVRTFAVAHPAEAVALREAGLEGPVLVFGVPLPEAFPLYARYGLAATGASLEVIDGLAAFFRDPARPLEVHLKVDTGMHRIGVAPEDAAEAVRRIQAAPGLRWRGLWTHLATADEPDPAFAQLQRDRFRDVLQRLDPPPGVQVHVANSGLLALVPQATRAHALVRAGGLLYGTPSTRTLEAALEVEPVMRLVTRVVHLQTVAAGETVSYGQTWRAERPTRIATIAAGYGDGIPRGLSNTGRVGIGGQLYPIAGRVCMDLLMVDLGPPDGPGAAFRIGDEAVLFGPGGPSALDQAEVVGTISYALTAGLTGRVPRVYRDAPSGA